MEKERKKQGQRPLGRERRYKMGKTEEGTQDGQGEEEDEEEQDREWGVPADKAKQHPPSKLSLAGSLPIPFPCHPSTEPGPMVCTRFSGGVPFRACWAFLAAPQALSGYRRRGHHEQAELPLSVSPQA